MNHSEYHVVPNPNGGWDVKKSGAHRASFHANTKAKAIVEGRRLSRTYGSELFIHNLQEHTKVCDSRRHDSYPCSQWNIKVRNSKGTDCYSACCRSIANLSEIRPRGGKGSNGGSSGGKK